MDKRLRKLKKIRIHREGTNTLTVSLILLIAVAFLLWRYVDCKVPFAAFVCVFSIVWMIVLNFYRCPKRFFEGSTERTVVAPADGTIV